LKGLSVMSLANTYGRPAWLSAVPKPDQDLTSKERDSDVWPDWSTDLSTSEIAQSAEKNKPSAVLREAVGAILYSVGLVVLLMVIVTVLHAR
jgi:hypothetical protein